MSNLAFASPVLSGYHQLLLAHQQDQTMVSPTLRPTSFDVLFGRGKPYQGHPGNIRLHKVVEVYRTRYSQVRRHIKTEIAEEIVQFIKSGGNKAGRFLKRADGDETWEEVSDTVAREKVSHALRGKPRKEGRGVGAKHYNSHADAIIEELKNTKRTASDDDKADQDIDLHQITKKRKIEEARSDSVAFTSRGNGIQTMLPFGTAPPAQPTRGWLTIPTTTSPGYLSNLGLRQQGLRQQVVQSQLLAAAIAERERRLQVELSVREFLQPMAASPPLLQNQQTILSSALLQSLRNTRQSKGLWF
jgi:hypothetical protein